MLGDRIKELREKKGLKQEELAKIMSVSSSTIGMYEINKREPNNEFIIKLANFFGVSTDYLLCKTNFKNDEIHSNFKVLPVYGQISAGQPNWAEECIEGHLPVDTDLMKIDNLKDYFFLRVNGESMNKIVKNGAFALIHKQEIVKDGEIAVVLVNGYDATLKKFTRQGDFIILEPQSNDASFKAQVYDKTTNIKVLGKYVGKMEINK